MAERHQPRPMRTAYSPPRGKPDMRDYSALRQQRGATPSQDFDLDNALYLHALSMRELGYQLMPEQQRRIDDHV